MAYDSIFPNYNRVLSFIKKYPEAFSEYEKKYLLDYSKYPLSRDRMIPDLVREVYDYLGLLSDDENIYLGFIDMLDKEFPIKDKQIVEVGGGIMPTLAKRISGMQDTGTIKVYDPRLSIYEEDTDKMILVREKFQRDTRIDGSDLVIAFMPCEAAFNVVEAATKNNVDFMLALCEGGPHGDIFDYFEDEDEWLNAVMHTAERRIEDHNMGELGIQYLKKYHDPYPVIYNKRK